MRKGRFSSQNMAFEKCHTVLLHFVHGLIWLRLYLGTIVCRYFSKLFSFLIFGLHGKCSIERCRSDSKIFTKLPLHVGIQILEEVISYEDVASILTWCIAMGIPFVTLSDIQGYITKESAAINRRLQEKIAAFGSETNKLVFHIESPVRNGEVSWQVLHKSEGTSQVNNKTRIALISAQDGRQDIIDSARQICRNVATKQCKASDVDVSHLDELINTSTSFPDPELIVNFGLLDSLIGFPPWKIRVTEIMSVPTHHNMSYQSFRAVLQAFSRTQQRFGK